MVEYRRLENNEEIYSNDYIIVDTKYRQCGISYYRKKPADFPNMIFYRKNYFTKPFGSKLD